jgi:hypothetical protein
MHDNENKMLCLSHHNAAKSIFNIDVETQKVIEEWKATNDNKSLKKICRLHKNNIGSSNDSNILSITEKGIYQLDPRLNSDIKTAEQRD